MFANTTILSSFFSCYFYSHISRPVSVILGLRAVKKDMKVMRRAWEIQEDEIKREFFVGQGSQGEVWKVILRSKLPCAMKIMSMNNNSISSDVDEADASSSISKSNCEASVDSTTTKLDNLCKSSSGSITMDKLNTDEAEFLMRIRHPRLVMFMGFGFDSTNTLFILTEYMEEGNLTKILHTDEGKKKYSQKWALKIRWLLDVAQGLHYLHSKGGLHRDLKSSNILLSKDKSNELRAKIADFGLSALVTRGKKRVRAKKIRGNHAWQADEWIKSMSTFVGSIPYMAPELMTKTSDNQTRYGPRIDIYSFGIVIYEVISQRKPWKDEITSHGIEGIIKAVKIGTRPSMSPQTLMMAPHELGNIMNECWRQHGVHRPSAKTLCGCLQNIYDTEIDERQQNESEVVVVETKI